MKPIIELRNVSFSYGETKVLDDLSLVLEYGKSYALIGHNGSGKSTLAKIIGGLYQPLKGELLVDDVIVTEKNISIIREKIGMVFQNPDNQFLGATVKEDIAFGLENKCVPREEMDSIILEYAKKVSIESYLEVEPTELSGGQKQRVALSGVLAMKPKILILDEATSMLDSKGKKEINELFKNASDTFKDLTTVMITHDLDEAMLVDMVILLDNGKIVAIAPPKELFSSLDLDNYSLTMPFCLEVSSKLNKINNNITLSYDNKELVDKICQYLLKK